MEKTTYVGLEPAITTIISKSKHLGWKAETWIKSDKDGFEFRLSTYKSQKQGVFTIASEGKRTKGEGVQMFEFALYDPNYRSWRTIHGDQRSTQKTVTERHEQGIKLFYEAFPQLRPA